MCRSNSYTGNSGSCIVDFVDICQPLLNTHLFPRLRLVVGFIRSSPNTNSHQKYFLSSKNQNKQVFLAKVILILVASVVTLITHPTCDLRLLHITKSQHYEARQTSSTSPTDKSHLSSPHLLPDSPHHPQKQLYCHSSPCTSANSIPHDPPAPSPNPS
jgi:hypothetical protein